MAIDTLGVASWGLLRTAPSKIEHLAASWGLLDPAPSPSAPTGPPPHIGHRNPFRILRRVLDWFF